MEGLFLEHNTVKQAALPVDFNLAAVTGARVGMVKTDKVAIVVSLGDSVGAAFDIEFKQHDAAAAGTTKALSIDNIYYHKVGAATSFTKVEPTGTAVDSITLDALFAADEGLAVFEIYGEDLDVNNGFNHVSANLTAAGAAKIANVEYVLHDMRNKPAYSEVI